MKWSGGPGPRFAIGALVFALGCGWVILDAVTWYLGQYYLGVSSGPTALGIVLRYYGIEVLEICVALAGAFVMYGALRDWRSGPCPESIRGILADSLASRRDLKIGAVAAIAYGIAYLFLSSMIVFQPLVNFAAEGISGTGWNAITCCGAPGTVPAIIVILSPQAHLGMQILPLDLLFAVMVPLLVGFNMTVAAHAITNKIVRSKVGLIGSVGVLAGLFTGCPTCAGLFLASAIGGFGGSTLAVALAPYQMFFVVVSIPILVASPMIIAHNAKRAIREACPV